MSKALVMGGGGPDASSVATMGADPHDSSVAPAAAVEGRRQGEADADRVGALWS
jgi:hypothetical protein